MSVELIAAPFQQNESTIQLARPVERPTPSARQERVADTVFTSGQEQVGALFLGLHMGLLMAHHLAVETFRDADREEEKGGCQCCRP